MSSEQNDWNIDGIQFSILSEKEIINRAITEINKTKLKEDDISVKGGLLDNRLETSVTTKPGNFGYIKLAKPVFNIGFTNYIGNIIKCICYHCSSLICDKEKPDFKKYMKLSDSSVRLQKIRKICDREPNCIVCKMVQPTYSVNLDSIDININTVQGKETSNLSAEKVKAIFSRVSDSDSKILGFDPKFVKLESLIMSTIIVPPPSIRPSLDIGGGLTSHDDMTHKYIEIVKINTILKELVNRGVENYKLKPLVDLLQYTISTHIDNTKYLNASRGRSGKSYISIKQKLDGKTGRVRGNLMGKRVNYSARSVIGGDPSISIDEVGIPYSVAMNCTEPEMVNDLNIERLRQNVKNGPTVYPGAKFVFRNGKKYTLTGKSIPINIQNGDIVRRHIEDGDMLILNRQPTLHRLSMMGHKAKVLPYSTFRLNLAITNPYNADFDGDEMNVHFPQTLQSITEVKEIMMSPQNIVSPNDSKPKTGLVQDSLLGIRKLTLRDTFLKKHTFMNIIMDLEDTWNHEIPIPAIIKPKPTWTGKQVISLLLPNMDFEKKANEHREFENEPLFISKSDTWVRIMDGELICGCLDKKSIGLSYSSIIHVVFNDMGPNKCTDFINKVQDISNRYLTIRSASAGVGDLIVSPETRQELFDYSDQQLENANKETEEDKITAAFATTLGDVTKIIYKTIDHNNNFYHMKTSGSKGKTHNIPNMMGLVGQQTLSGGRMRNAFGNRTLPHYDFTDKSPRSKGYIRNCLINGLEPDEFFWLTISGREGITDTAVKTASSGYIQRRFIKSMEDICCLYDGTVRNSMNDIVQFSYGGDSLNPKYIESAKMDLSKKSLSDLKKMLNISNESLIKKQSKQIISDWNYLKNNNIEEGFNFWFPYKLERIILTAKKTTYKNDKITMKHIDTQVENLFNDIDSMYTIPTSNKHLKETMIEEITRFMKINLRYELSIVNVMNKYKLSKTQFDTVINYIRNQYEKAIVHAGEMVGVTAAQSFGEPTTQMTLNTFHSAGMASANVTLGVPRVEEIIKFAKKINTPSIILMPKKGITETEINKLIDNLKYISFNTIIQSINIVSKNSQYLWDFIVIFKKNTTYDIKKSKSHFVKFFNSHSIISEYKIDKFNNEKMLISINVDKRKNKDTQRKLLFKIKNDCLQTKISGIKGIDLIKKLDMKTYKKNISVQRVKNKVHHNFALHIEKISKTDIHILQEILSLDNIDQRLTISNEMREVQEILGLEAARQVFFNEMRTVFAAYGIDITKHHYEVLADSVSYSGKFTAIARTGVNRRETGPLTKASFEETFSMFMKGGLFGEYDGLFGVSGNILVGKKPGFGTGLPHIIL